MQLGRSFYLWLCLFHLRLVPVAHDTNLAWVFYLQLKFGLLFGLMVENQVGIFAYRSPRPEIGFGLFYLRLPHRE